MPRRRVLSVGALFVVLTLVQIGGVAEAASVPGAPTGLEVVGGDGQLDLSWDAPISNGGSAITGYRIDFTSNTSVGVVSGMFQTQVASTSYTLTDLTNGGVYSVTVAAVNAEGTGVATAAIQGTPYTQSGPPSGLNGVLVGETLVLSWLVPSVTGGTVVTGYRIEQRVTGGDLWTVVIDNTGSVFTTYNVLGLVEGTAYDFQVSAVNAAGLGPMSASWSATVPATTTLATVPATTTLATVPATTTLATAATPVPPTPCTTAPPPTAFVDSSPDSRVPPAPLYVC